MAIELPTENSKPEITGIPDNFSMVLFGQPKVGKTTFAAEFPDSILLECESGGAKYTSCKKVDINNITELREAHKLLMSNETFKTVIIDSIDKVAEWLEAEICKSMNIKNIMETKKGERFGSQWGEYKENVLKTINAFLMLNKKVIFIGHLKKADTDGNGGVINPKTINIYGQTATHILSTIDNIGYMFAREDTNKKIKRYLSFKAGEMVESGSRCPAISDKVIELPLGKGYKAFEKCFTEYGKKEGK